MGVREITREQYEEERKGQGSMTASDTTRKPSMRGRFDIVVEAAGPEMVGFVTASERYGLDAEGTLRSFKRDLLGFNIPDDRVSDEEYNGQGSTSRYREPEIRRWPIVFRNHSFPGPKQSVLFTCSRSVDGTEEGFDSTWFLPDSSSPSGLGDQRRATHLESIGQKTGKFHRDIWVEKLVMRDKAGWKTRGMQTDLLVIQTTLIGLHNMLTDMLGMTSNWQEKRRGMVMGLRAFKADDSVLDSIYSHLKDPESEKGETRARVNKSTFGSGSMGWGGTGQTKAVVRSSLAEGRWKW